MNLFRGKLAVSLRVSISFITSFQFFECTRKKMECNGNYFRVHSNNYIYTYTLNTDNIGKKYVRTCTRVRTHGTFHYSSVSSVICMGEIRI